MLRNIFYIFCFMIITTLQSFPQSTWVPFLQQAKTKPTTNLTLSNSNIVSFTVQINGMETSGRKIGEVSYQGLSIPDCEVMTKEGLPQVPVITKLIAIPDCGEVSISVSPSNEFHFSNYNILPAPRYEKKKLPDGSENFVPVYEENKSIYTGNTEFPGKYGEITEIGYVRDQKVARVVIYPVQFNPAKKEIKTCTNFSISLSFASPTSAVNKELGIFRNMVHHAALNYELSGISASTKDVNKATGKNLAKVTSGSVTRVTDLSTLVGANAIPVDYLIVTHSSLFNSGYLTTLANWRRDLNGYDVVICFVDENGTNDIYHFEDTPGHIKYPSTSTTRYVSIRDFIADVYNDGTANNTGDGHLGYICLVGDALQDDNSTEMLPAEYYYPGYGAAGDYYYACTGGDSDDLQDVMYGRISVGNETELSAVVNKIISYETNSNGSWNEDHTFVSFSPDLWDYGTDYPAMTNMTSLVPSTCQKSYLYRAFDYSSASSVTSVNSIFARRFTYALYTDPTSLCYSQELNDSLYDHQLQGINNGIHTFIYEGHGGWNALGANEGSGRYIFRASEIGTRLSNDLYSFMIFNCCDAGHLDHNSGDCVAEVAANLANKGAIGVLASTRDSYTSAFGSVDKYVLEAQYNSLSHVMGEAIMESKLLLSSIFRRQYNLYGDPALNLWPTGYTVAEDMTISGENTISENLTVSSGITLTISAGATLKFADGVSLIINGVLDVQGTSNGPITFTSLSGTSPGSWGSIQINGSGASGSSISYANIQYGTEIDIINANNVTIQNCDILNSSMKGILFYGGSGCQALNNTISNSNIYHGIEIGGSASVNCYNNSITKNSPSIGRGVGILYGGGTSGIAAQNDISGWDWGIGGIWGALPYSQLPLYAERNNRIRNCNIGLVFYRESYGNFGGVPGSSPCGTNSIYSNTTNVAVGTSYTSYASGLYAKENWWGSAPPNTSLFTVGPSAYFYYDSYLSSDPWAGIAKTGSNTTTVASVAKGVQRSLTSKAPPNEQAGSLLQGTKLRLNKKYKEAKDFFVSYINNFPDNQQAYVELYNCYSKETADDIISFFNSLPLKASNDHKLLLAYLYLKQGNVNMAEKVNDKIILENQNTSLSEKAMINNAYIALYNENNVDKAVNIFKMVLKKSELSTEMELSDLQNAIKTYAEALGNNVVDLSGLKKNLSNDNLIPDNYELFHNYPNPFNPTTIINYQLPKDGIVTLKVYDILGREVATLVNEFKASGRYEITFDAKNLSSGMYIYQLRVNDFIESKKLILMK